MVRHRDHGGEPFFPQLLTLPSPPASPTPLEWVPACGRGENGNGNTDRGDSSTGETPIVPSGVGLARSDGVVISLGNDATIAVGIRELLLKLSGRRPAIPLPTGSGPARGTRGSALWLNDLNLGISFGSKFVTNDGFEIAVDLVADRVAAFQ